MIKFPKVLLIAPSYITEPNTMYFPIGISYLCSYLEKKGVVVDGFNMNNFGLEKGLDKLKEKISNNNYDVIGIGGLTIAFEQIDILVKELRKLTNAQIVLGGGITACESDIVIKEIKPNYMVISEAELIFEELLLHISAQGVWKLDKNGDIVYKNSESYSVEKLDDLPFPNYEMMGIDKYIELQTGQEWRHHKTDPFIGKSIPISASRSCPFKCTFCYHAGMGKYRKHSVEYAIKFIKTLKEKYSVSHYSIYDELFSLNKKRVLEFCEGIKNLNITFECQLRVDQIDLEMLLLMKEAGCTEISYGIESGSDKIIDSMQKKITTKQIENALNLTRKARIGIQGNFLYGDPLETEETIEESLNFQEKNKLYFNDWSMVIPYPGTVLHNLALSKDLIKNRLEFIKVVSNTSKYLWTSAINLTNFSNKEFLNNYSYLRELNDKNHRKILTKIKTSKIINKNSSYLEVECPNCNKETIYQNFPFPFNSENIFTDKESFYGFLGINLVCPNCRQKHHLLPKDIPHISILFRNFENEFENFLSKNNEIIVMPAIDRYFYSIKSDTQMLDINPFKVFDLRDYRINDIFLGKVVEKLNEKNLRNVKDKAFIIYPWVEANTAYNLLIKSGVPKEKILMWNKI